MALLTNGAAPLTPRTTALRSGITRAHAVGAGSKSRAIARLKGLPKQPARTVKFMTLKKHTPERRTAGSVTGPGNCPAGASIRQPTRARHRYT